MPLATSKAVVAIGLVCGSYHITLNSPNRLTLTDSDGFTLQMQKSINGDCTGRRNCYQSGQFMVNLRESAKRPHVWVNTDVDDIPGMGERIRCQRLKP